MAPSAWIGLQRQVVGRPNPTGHRQAVGNPGAQGDVEVWDQAHGGGEHGHVGGIRVQAKGGGEQVEAPPQQAHHALESQAGVEPSVNPQQAAAVETGQVGHPHGEVWAQAEPQVVKAHKPDVGDTGTQEPTGITLHLRPEQHQRLLEGPAGFDQLRHAGHAHPWRLLTGQAAGLHVDVAPGNRELPADIHGVEAAADAELACGHGPDPRHREGNRGQLHGQAGFLTIGHLAGPQQAQRTAAPHRALLPHPGAELLQH